MATRPHPSLFQNFADLRADYDAARGSRFRRKRTGVASSGSGADYHYRSEADYLRMMELAYDLFRNNIVVGQAVRRLVANIIQDGFTLDPQTGDAKVNEDLAGRWIDYSEDREQVDLAGELTFHGMEKLVLQSRVVAGDILALMDRRGPIKLVEAHRIRTPSRTVRNVVHGVLMDEFRRRLEYWVTRDEIEPFRAVAKVGQMTKYPVRDAAGFRQAIHVYDPDRVSQTRGVTALAPVTDTAGMGDDLFFAQLVKAQVTSCYAILHELAEGAGPSEPSAQRGELTTETRPDGTTRRIEGIAPGMEIFGYPGERLVGFSPNVPNPEFFQHAMLILNVIAINLDLPLAVLLLDPSKTNFSGWRGAMDQARMRFRAFQRWLVNFFHRPVYVYKLHQWIESDPALKTAAAREGVKIFKHRWNVPGWPYIEPLKDASADLLRLRNALISHRRRCAERGYDWGDLSTEICEDNALLIEKAFNTAEELNEKYPKLGVTWREVASLPTPDGVSITLAADAGREETTDGTG